jgi:arylsulfatase A-like enzyme
LFWVGGSSGRVGKQTIEDTGPLTQERMKNFDAGEVVPKADAFMKKAKDDGKPFFIWLNTSRMHLYTRLNDEWRYAAEQYTSEADIHGSGMLQHDHDVGLVLDFLKQQGDEGDGAVQNRPLQLPGQSERLSRGQEWSCALATGEGRG